MELSQRASSVALIALTAVFALIALLWMTEEMHGIKSHIAALIGLTALFIPGVIGFRWKEIQDRTIWGTMLLTMMR